MPTTTIALAAASVNGAAVAARSAARRADCEHAVRDLNGTRMSVSQQQKFADCVRLLHPKGLDGAEVLAAKALIVIGLVGFLFGAKWGYDEDGILFGIACAIGFGLVLPVVTVILAAMGYAVYWLFT